MKTFDVKYWEEKCGPESFEIKTMELPIEMEKQFIKDFHDPKKGCVAITIPSKQQLDEWIKNNQK